MLRLGIRVSSVSSSGRGHLERCLAVRNHLREKVYWFVDFKSQFIIDKISGSDEVFFENGRDKFSFLKRSIKNNNINCVLIDNYEIDSNDISMLDNCLPVITFIDKSIYSKSDIIICSQPINIKRRKGIKYLLGPKYAPVMQKFIIKSQKNKLRNKILISFGAFDSQGITLNVIKAIKALFMSHSYNYSVLIVLTKDSPIIGKVRVLIKDYINFELVLDSKNMQDIYRNCKIAIGAPGLSFLERMASGLPSLLIPQNIIHKDLIEEWVKLGCALSCENSINLIEKKLNYLLSCEDLLKNISLKGKNIVDGKGASRIAKEIINFMELR